MMIHDPRPCELGEGALWHPTRNQLFWFDILNARLLTQGPKTHWQFPHMVSAAAWVDDKTLLIASERDLALFDLTTGTSQSLTPLESDNPETRSNDGRADRQGGFWIGTMGKDPKNRRGKGAIYRYYKGELRQLFPKISIPNAICFTPDGTKAYFADTMEGKVWSVTLNPQGWPNAEPTLFLDLKSQGLHPDGAVTTADGTFWNAQWGASRVAAYSPTGQFLHAVQFNAPHTSCPAFGGPDLTTLFVTTALEEMSPDARAAYPDAGKTFATETTTKGLPEPRFIP